MSDILKQIQALQEQFSNLLGEELEKEGPKGEIKDLSRPPKKDYFDKKIEAAKTNFRTADKVARNKWKESKATDDIDSSGYSDSYANARTADNEREKALDNYEYTKKEMNAARKGKRIEPKNAMEQIKRIRARREGAIKMNDNNSYNEIVSQIMDLKEAFSNLFEVDGDGLGNPAVDVPPSQNKIKRDRRTKDGKVELVSVEDELFPYDGNKKEQYRQKILDTINGMIQGTSTLEDLLQIVRQKKAPLKEAMELLEAVKDQVKNHQKYHGGAATFSYKGNNYSYTPERGLKKGGETRDERNPVKQIVDAENKEFDDVRKYKYDLGRQSRTINKKLNKEVKKLEKTEGKGAFPGKTNDTIKKLIDMSTVNSSNRADADKYFAEVNAKQKKLANDAKGVKYEAKDFYNTKKSDSYGVKPTVKTSEALEEALEIMEAIINEVSIGKWKEAAASSLPKRQEEAEAAKAAAEKGWEEYDKVSREHPEDEPALYRLAQAKDEEAAKAEDKADHAYAVTRLKTHDKANANKAIKAAKKVQDKREDEFGRNPEKRTFLRSGKANQLAAADPVKSRADEALEEALSLMEAIINEVSDKTIASTALKRVKRAIKAEEDGNLEKAAQETEHYNNIQNKWAKLVGKGLAKGYVKESIELLEDLINEMKPATYGVAMGKRANKLMADINKNDELEQSYYKAKDSGNAKETEKAADEWNKHDSYMRHDRSSNQNKLGRDIARINLIADDSKWSPEQRAEFNKAYNKTKTVTRKNGKDYKFYTKW